MQDCPDGCGPFDSSGNVQENSLWVLIVSVYWNDSGLIVGAANGFLSL